MKNITSLLIALTIVAILSCNDKKDSTTVVVTTPISGIFVGIDSVESSGDKPAIMILTKMLREGQVDTAVFLLNRPDANELLGQLDKERNFIHNAPRDIVCTFTATCSEAFYNSDRPNKIYILAGAQSFTTKLNAQL